MNISIQSYLLELPHKINVSINTFCFPVFVLSIATLFILSLSWSVSIVRGLMRRHKIFKLSNFRDETERKEMFNNHKSYRTRDIFLIIICLFESSLLPNYLIYASTRKLVVGRNFNSTSLTGVHAYGFEQEFYFSLFYPTIRLLRTLLVIEIYSLLIFVRILTQFLVHKYSFYKYNLNLKTTLSISLSFLFVLFICGLTRVLLAPFYFTIAFAILFEYLLLVKVTMKLRRLLKRRLTDAVINESVHICLYYKTVYGNYKCFSIVLLLSLFFLCASYLIFCIHSVVVTILVLPNDWFSLVLYRPEILNMHQQLNSHPNVRIYNLFVCSIQELFLTFGMCLQTASYLFVSLINLFRSIRKRMRGNNINAMLIQKLIEKHNNAYERNY